MKILLAIDGSRFSEAAAGAVASHFRGEDTKIVVLQVVEPLAFSVPPQMAPGYAPEMAPRLQEELKRAKDSVLQTAGTLRKAGFKAETCVSEKEIRTGILDLAAEWHADLIVLGSHGEKGLRQNFCSGV